MLPSRDTNLTPKAPLSLLFGYSAKVNTPTHVLIYPPNALLGKRSSPSAHSAVCGFREACLHSATHYCHKTSQINKKTFNKSDK